MAILTVTNTNDNGPGSLRTAIDTAQTGDTILFSASLANQAITLNSQLSLLRTITIDGVDAPGLTISGNNAVRVFDITGIGTTVNINNLTIANGRATSGIGDDRAGAAIRGTNNTTLNVNNTTFTNNVAGFAGAIYTGFTSNNTVTNSTFNGNDGTLDGSERGGGAIATQSNGSLTVINSTFTNNRGINGGAINNLLGELTIENSTFTNNDTTQGTGINTNGYGGAVYVDGANASGPGFGPGLAGGTIAIRDSRFVGNTGTGQGGGLFLFIYPADELVLEDSTILNNQVVKGAGSDAFGGGVRIGNGPYTITNTTFANNSAEAQGGGLWVGGTTPGSITNSTFFGNQAIDPNSSNAITLGGGLLFSTTSPQQLTNVTIASNEAGTEGGGIVGNTNVTLTNTIVANNTANNPFGTKQNASNGQGFNASPPPIFSDGGGNLEWPAITHNFDNPNITATVLQADPNLGTLADNGAGIFTVPLLPGSAAIDAGVNGGAPDTDQRGEARPIDGDSNGSAIVDIGAFEFNAGVVFTNLAIAATNATLVEGDSGTQTFTFTVTRSGDTTGTHTVAWMVAGTETTPADAGDFVGGTLPTDSLTFGTNETLKEITIDVRGDTIVEPDETFTVTLSNPTNGATVTTATGTGTILNDDDMTPTLPTITLSANPGSVLEDGVSNLVYTFSRTGVVDNPLTVNYTVGGTASFNSDYTQIGTASFGATAGSITLAAGATTATVTIDPTGDTTPESDETVALTLLEDAAYTIGTSGAVTRLIIDEDNATHDPVQVIFAADGDDLIRDQFAYALTGTGNGTTVIVELASRNFATEDAFDNLVGLYEVADVNGGIDTDGDGVVDLLPDNPATYAEYAITNRVVDFSIRAGSLGDPEKNTTIEQFGEVLLEGGKLYAPFLLANGGDLGFDGFIEAETNETDGVFNDAADFEFDRVLYFPFQVANPDGTAHLKSLGNDSFGFEDIGSNVGTSDEDFDDIIFALQFSIDASTLPTVSLAVSPTTVSETGATDLLYTFSRTGDLTNALTVNYRIGGTASFNADYSQTGADSFDGTTGSITIAAGTSTATIVLDVVDDATPESDETVSLTLTDDSAYTIATTASVVGNLTDGTVDTPAPELEPIEKTGLEDTIVPFTLADFINAFSDEQDEDDNLQAIRVLSLPANGTLTFNDVTVTTGLVIQANQLEQLQYSPASDTSGPFSFLVTAQDDGDGVNESEPTTVTIDLAPVNDAPRFTLTDNADQITPAGQSVTLTDFTTEISAGPADESNQSLTFEITTTGEDIFSQLPQLSNDGTLTYSLQDDIFGVATVTLVLTDDGGIANGGSDRSAEQTFTITPTRTDQSAIVVAEADSNGLIGSRFAYDLTQADNGTPVVAQLTEDFVSRVEAAFDNLIGVYEVVDAAGGIDTDNNGVADLFPENRSAYAEYAITNRVDDFLLRGGSNGDPNRNTTVAEFGDVLLTGGRRYAPFVIANGGAQGFDGFIEAEQGESDGVFNDAADFASDRVMYFAFAAANPDGVEHLKSFGNNLFGFEDLPTNLGISDNDFNDAFFQFNFVTVG